MEVYYLKLSVWNVLPVPNHLRINLYVLDVTSIRFWRKKQAANKAEINVEVAQDVSRVQREWLVSLKKEFAYQQILK